MKQSFVQTLLPETFCKGLFHQVHTNFRIAPRKSLYNTDKGRTRPDRTGSAHFQRFTDLISVFRVYTKDENNERVYVQPIEKCLKKSGSSQSLESMAVSLFDISKEHSHIWDLRRNKYYDYGKQISNIRV